MPDQTITCPNCSTDIPLTEALSEQIKKELTSQLAQEEKKKIEALEKEKEKLKKIEKDLEEQQKGFSEKVAKQVKEEKNKLWKLAQEKAKEKQDKEFKNLEETLKEQAEKLEKSEKIELELRKRTRDLEEKEKKIELELARKIDEERKKIEEKTKKQEEESYQLKIKEKDKQMDILKKTIADLKRQSEQGSMQIQGEVQEDDLKEILSTQFATDIISDVPTGIKGADLIQYINGNLGNKSGTILWESKNTKAFMESWIAKLKNDQGKVKADVAILVSQAMPDDVSSFALRNGVWIVSYQFAIPLVAALRLHVIELHKVKQSLDGQDEKMNLLYRYLTGSQFKNRIENIVMAFMSMQGDLESEKRSLNRIWNKREKEIQKVLMSTSSLYGDLQGIIGGSLPTIQQLELPEGEFESESQGLFDK